MTAGGKPGNPNPGFPPFPPSLEIALRFPHSHSHDSCPYNHQGTRNGLSKVLPMSSDRSVTYVPGRTTAQKSLDRLSCPAVYLTRRLFNQWVYNKARPIHS